MAAKTNLEDIIRGDDLVYTVVVSDQGSIVDVTTDDFVMTLKKNSADPDVLAVMQVSVTPTDGSTGEVIFALSATDTTILAGLYNYDVQWKRVTSGAGEIVTLLYGKVNVIQDVTHGV